jgi:hypothetical protein
MDDTCPFPSGFPTLGIRVSIIVMTFLVGECYGSPKKQEF